MWTTRVTEVRGGSCIGLRRNGEPVPYRDVVEAWRRDDEFATWFSSLLASSPIAAYRWETPAVSAATIDQAFEFVLIEARELMRTADPASFAEQFDAHPGTSVVAFPNLGRDAVMVVPKPHGDHTAYGHLAAFVRGAPGPQQRALWQAVGQALHHRIGDRPVWLSTAGAGVAWLHVRIDDRPKYYHHSAYRQEAPGASVVRHVMGEGQARASARAAQCSRSAVPPGRRFVMAGEHGDQSSILDAASRRSGQVDRILQGIGFRSE